MAKEMLILIGLQLGASKKGLSEIIGISPSALSRRYDAARRKLRDNASTSKLASEIIQQYGSGADGESQNRKPDPDLKSLTLW